MYNPEALYRALIHASPDGIVISDLYGRISFASPAALEMFDLESPEQALGTTVLEWIDPQDREKAVRNISGIFQGQASTDHQYRLHSIKGRSFTVEIRSALLPDDSGQVTGMVSNLRDVTESWRAKEALLHSEERFRSVVQANPLGMHFYRLDSAGRLILEDANPAAERILKIEHTQLFGKTIEEAFPGLVETGVPTIYRRLASEGGQWRSEQVLYDQDKISGAYEVIAFQSSPGHMVATFSDILERKQAQEALRVSLESLRLLREIDQVIIEHEDAQSSLDALSRLIAGYFKAHAVEILFYDADRQTFQRAARCGFRSPLYDVPFTASDGIPGLVLKTGRLVALSDLYAQADLSGLTFYQQEEISSGYSAPLATPNRLQGVLQLFYREKTALPAHTIEFLELVSNQVAIAIEKTSLWESRRQALDELVSAYATTLEGWVSALDLRDNETEHHTRRVTDLTVETVLAMGLPPDVLEDIHRGALLHDIGKIGIPDSILFKQGPLTDEEWVIMRTHPDLARRMLLPIHYLNRAIDIPYCHHERWDGSGYPRGLAGEEIPLAARIFAVVDVWDALTSDRPYRKAWPKEDAVAYIRENAGKLFDPCAAQVFLQLIQCPE